MKFYQQNQTKVILLTESLSESDQLIKTMQLIQSLFTNETEINIMQENEKNFLFGR
jgi:hypothetical protein